MKIEKAIKNLTKAKRDCGMISSAEYTQTIKIAIAALERVGDMRSSPCTTADELLLGETEEEMKIYIGKHDKNDNPIAVGDNVITNEAGWIGTVTVVLLDESGGYSAEPEWDKCEVVEEAA